MTQAAPDFETIVISGVGLIGGSIAAALRANGYRGRIVGMGRNETRLQPAIERKLIDRAITNAADIPAHPLLFVCCTPVNTIVDGIRAVAAQAAPGSVLTDAGSTKSAICESLQSGLPSGVEFVGSHPLAGSEKRGCEFSDATLFQNRLCVLTPTENSSPQAVSHVGNFWNFIGCETVEVDPETHDRFLAVTSHLPHIVAAALASLLTSDNNRFASTGFRDTTRVASGDPQLWEAILLENSAAILAAIDSFQNQIDELKSALKSRDANAIREWLAVAKQQRDERFG